MPVVYASGGVMNKKRVSTVIAEMNKLAGRFEELSHSGITMNGKKVIMVRPEALEDLEECLSNWAEVLSEDMK